MTFLAIFSYEIIVIMAFSFKFSSFILYIFHMQKQTSLFSFACISRPCLHRGPSGYITYSITGLNIRTDLSHTQTPILYNCLSDQLIALSRRSS